MYKQCTNSAQAMHEQCTSNVHAMHEQCKKQIKTRTVYYISYYAIYYHFGQLKMTE